MAKSNQTGKGNALQALTSAALVLPGLLSGAKAAETGVAGFQYSRYQEGKRNIFNVPNNLDPIQVDTIYGQARLMLSDRIRFAFNYTQDTWSGATPVATAPLVAGSNRAIQENGPDGLVTVGASPLLNTRLFLDHDFQPLNINLINGQNSGVELQPVHILAMASPETRKQGDFSLAYEWDEAEISLSGGVSNENDYQSNFGGINGRWDFNQKLTTLNGGFSYTSSTISAILDHDPSPYINKIEFQDRIENRGGSEILNENRDEWAAGFSLSQILNPHTVVEGSFGYKHSSGFLSNPYKAVTTIFVDPEQISSDPSIPIPGNVKALMEKRPDKRNQFNFAARLVQYIEPMDAALHFNYNFSHDDWDINAHTFEADWVQPLGKGWSVTPRIRYYSQNQANFYTPYIITKQPYSQLAVDEQGREVFVDFDNPDNGNEYHYEDSGFLVDQNGQVVDESTVNIINKTTPFSTEQLPENYSSDHRLSGFGTLSGGITLSKVFSRGIQLDVGFEYYTHQGALKLGGGGEGDYADFDYFVANAAISVNLDAMSMHAHSHSGHSEHDGHGTMHQHALPAGLMVAHMLPKADDFMIGYRYMWGRKDGDTLHGTDPASDYQIVNNGCGIELCRFTPTFMEMGMHMLNIMYAPTDWLNFMLMPQFVDKEMNLRELDGRPPPSPDVHEHTGLAGHSTGGVGDTQMFALVKVFQDSMHHVHLGLGLSAPTGDVDLEFRRVAQQDGGIIHYGMQLGSGTWDFLPSMTYTGQIHPWSWGAQFSGVVRLQTQNESGYRLGDRFQGTLWGGYSITDWLSATLRGIYTTQGKIKGQFNSYNGQAGPMDFPQNYGGKYWDLGMGLSATVPSGDLVGNTISFEWLQPLSDDVNGYQLERSGALSLSWSYMF